MGPEFYLRSERGTLSLEALIGVLRRGIWNDKDFWCKVTVDVISMS